MGITEALYIPAALGLIGALHSTGTRSRAMAIHGTAQSAGMIIGSWYGGWAADSLSWRIGLVILAVVGVSYAPALGIYFRRLPKIEIRHSPRVSSPS